MIELAALFLALDWLLRAVREARGDK